MNKTLFGTDGIRNKVGTTPFTAEHLPQLGKAIALWAQKKYSRTPTILLAHDTRVSADLVKSGLKTGLLVYPVKIYDAEVLPTPAVYCLVKNDPQFDCGIIISASHNPYYDNGIKIVDGKTGKITPIDEQIITDYYYQTHHNDYNAVGTQLTHTTAQQNYGEYLKKFFKPHFLFGKKIVLDCANGAASQVGPEIFEFFGAHVIVINNRPNGININKQCGALHTTALQNTVTDHQADCGFAFDGDADRVMAVNTLGQLKNGDDILALLLNHPLYATSSAVVGTIMSNKGFESYLTTHNKHLYRTPVGDKHIAAKILEHNLVLGGEPSGHIIANDYLSSGDGIFIALRIAETMLHTNNWTMESFTKYPTVSANIPITTKKDLTNHPSIIAVEKALTNGRVIVRYSGTEPMVRIMIEDADFDRAQSLCSSLSKVLQKELN